MMFADMPLTAHQSMIVARTAKARHQRSEKEACMARCSADFTSMKRRRDLAHRTHEQKLTAVKNTVHRNLKMFTKQAQARATAFILSMLVYVRISNQMLKGFHHLIAAQLKCHVNLHV